MVHESVFAGNKKKAFPQWEKGGSKIVQIKLL
jgi:hypothetical protein